MEMYPRFTNLINVNSKILTSQAIRAILI